MGGLGEMAPRIGDVLKGLAGTDSAGPAARLLPDPGLTVFWRDLAERAPLGAGETGPGAGPRDIVWIAAAPDLGVLLVSSCEGCGGACSGHRIASDGSVGAGQVEIARSATATPEQMAAYLTKGYWIEKGEIPHSWDTAASNVITVNLTAVSAQMKTLIRAALKSWETVADIDFREVSGRADITFTSNRSGANTTAVYETDGDMVRATVNISESWLKANGTTLGSYSLQTCIHEIGHALGLGHAGGYGISGGTIYANDSWQMSALSYTSQSENGTVNADRATVVTPMMADIIAVQSLYGKPTGGPTAGNTVYGKGATLGTYMDDVFAGRGASPGANAMTIFDEGGRDRFDFSADTKAQRVDLNGGAVSDVFGKKGNLVIAKGTVIEDYVAGQGSDNVRGNSAGNSIAGRDGADTLYGRDGNDTLDGGTGEDGLFGGNGTDRLLGSSGNDMLRGDAGADTLDGGEGHDSLRGDAGDDVLSGKNGNDRLAGSDGADRLNGDGGHDALSGDAGNDTLSGGSGDDTMAGGVGSDVFVFRAGRDAVRDFADNIDTLRIDDSLFGGQNLSAAQVIDTYAKVVGGAVVFDFGSGNTLNLQGITSVSVLVNDLEII
jgi:serralysin